MGPPPQRRFTQEHERSDVVNHIVGPLGPKGSAVPVLVPPRIRRPAIEGAEGGERGDGVPRAEAYKSRVPVPTNRKNHSAVSRAARPLVRSIKLRNRSASMAAGTTPRQRGRRRLQPPPLAPSGCNPWTRPRNIH